MFQTGRLLAMNPGQAIRCDDFGRINRCDLHAGLVILEILAFQSVLGIIAPDERLAALKVVPPFGVVAGITQGAATRRLSTTG